jgi:hypothetical protein
VQAALTPKLQKISWLIGHAYRRPTTMLMCILAIAGLDPLVLVGVVLLGLLAALSWLSRRLRGAGAALGHGRESVSLTGQHAVHVIEIAGRRLLVGTGPSGAPRVLAELGEVELGRGGGGGGAGAGAGASAEPAGPWSELIERFGARLGGLGGG